jgi:predicted dienelactone hydrolase
MHQSLLGPGRWWLALAAGLLGCADDSEAPPPDPSGPTASELLEPGPHAVGFQQIDITYAAAGTGEERVLPLRLWYPAVDAGEDNAMYSLSGVVSIATEGALAAPAVAPDGPFPLAVYSHGSGGEGLLAYPYGEHFASHGWVVVAPNHMGNTALEELGGNGDPFASIALNRPHDISAVIDAMADGPSGSSLAGAARTESVFLFGHSFGAYTTFAGGGVDLDFDALVASCEAESCDLYAEAAIAEAFGAGFGDTRVVAIAPQAPALVPAYAEGALAGLEVPTMLMSGRRDITTTDAVQARPAWSALDRPDDLWVEIPDGGHLSFITVCHDLEQSLLEAFQPTAPQDGCGPDFADTREVVPVLAGYLLGFARIHVLGEPAFDALLRGPAFHPAFVVSSH